MTKLITRRKMRNRNSKYNFKKVFLSVHKFSSFKAIKAVHRNRALYENIRPERKALIGV